MKTKTKEQMAEEDLVIKTTDYVVKSKPQKPKKEKQHKKEKQDTKDNSKKDKPKEQKPSKQKAKGKQKKVKSKKQKQPEFEKGLFVRDLKIDLNVNLFILTSMLVVFNCAFIICAILLIYWINVWYVWVIDIVLVVCALVHSVCSFFYNKKNYYFRIYKNCMLLNSIWYCNTIIDFKEVKRIKTKIGFWDRVLGRGTCTLTIYLNNDFRTKINLYFLKEDPKKLIQDLMAYTQKEYKKTSGN